jgi:isoquinoline 1-oxidoreductase alpha subunit
MSAALSKARRLGRSGRSTVAVAALLPDREPALTCPARPGGCFTATVDNDTWPGPCFSHPSPNKQVRPPMAVTLTVNGEQRSLDVDPTTPLLWALRDELRLTGTKFGCGIAQCGACTVHIDGEARRSCVTPVSAATGRQITTIEGLEGPEAEAVRAAWVQFDTPQCGYCQSGQVMSAVALLKENPKPTDEDINAAMKGVICRCATYVRIRSAIAAASNELEA